MMIQLDTGDTRTGRALAIAETAGQWLKVRTRDGRKLYGVPAQSEPGRYYLADCRECECPDFRRRQQPCKHVLAVRLHVARVAADRPKAKARPTSDARTGALAARYVAIFGSAA